MITCPRHADTDASLAVYHDHGWCYGGCGWFSPDDLLAQSRTRLEDLPTASPSTVKAEVKLPSPTMIEIWHRNLIDPTSATASRVDWLTERGISLATMERHRLGHTGRYFTIPIWSRGHAGAPGSRLVGIRRRRDDIYCDPDAPKYLHPYGQPALIYRPNPQGKVVAITEGEFDALLLAQHGIDAMTSTGGSGKLGKAFDGWTFRRPVYVMTDQDEAGEIAYQELAEGIDGNVIRVRWTGAKDVSEALQGQSSAERMMTIRQWMMSGG